MTQLTFVDGEYRTAPQQVSWFATQFPSLSFFRRMAGIVGRAGFKASRGPYGDQDWVNSSLEVLRALERVGVEFEVTGIEQLKRFDSPCLVVGNHMSTLETMVLPGLVQPCRDVTFVVKQSLLEYPVFKHVMRSRDPIAVSQTHPRADFKAMMQGGVERLAQGRSLIVFPEGERAAKFDPARFNTIGVKLARKAGVPIVPCALDSSAWGIGKWIPDVGKIDPARKVRFAFGEPIEVEGRGTEAQEAIIEFITEKLIAWGGDRELCTAAEGDKGANLSN
jgi:1-acyl-sn-glycerol-3-phosphate acyltransferase